MRLGGGREDRIRERNARLAKEGFDGDGQERTWGGRRMVDVRCFKCGAKLAEVPRAGPEDVIVLPPDEVEFHGDLPNPHTVVVQCRRCRERRALIRPPGKPPAANGTEKGP